jgi:NADH-quinone oxidoreductase subunit M
MVQRVAFGIPDPHALPKLRDLNLREMVTLVPLVVLIFVIGLFPNPILTRMHPSVEKILARAFPPAAEQAEALHRVDPFTLSVERITSTTGPTFSQEAQAVSEGRAR